VNFKPDANVEEVFGLSKPKENLNAPLTEEQQKSFEGWDWTADDQELPTPDPRRVAKYLKKRKKKGGSGTVKLKSTTGSRGENGDQKIVVTKKLEGSSNSQEPITSPKGKETKGDD